MPGMSTITFDTRVTREHFDNKIELLEAKFDKLILDDGYPHRHRGGRLRQAVLLTGAPPDHQVRHDDFGMDGLPPPSHRNVTVLRC